MGTQSVNDISDINDDVRDLAQRIVDKVDELVAAVETLDGNKWLTLADQIDALNFQLQNVLVPETKSETVSV